jgi:hypothetical protein
MAAHIWVCRAQHSMNIQVPEPTGSRRLEYEFIPGVNTAGTSGLLSPAPAPHCCVSAHGSPNLSSHNQQRSHLLPAWLHHRLLLGKVLQAPHLPKESPQRLTKDSGSVHGSSLGYRGFELYIVRVIVFVLFRVICCYVV